MHVPLELRKKAGTSRLLRLIPFWASHLVLTFATFYGVSWIGLFQVLSCIASLTLIALATYHKVTKGPWQYTRAGITLWFTDIDLYWDPDDFERFYHAFSEQWVEAPRTRSEPLRDLEGYEIIITKRERPRSRARHFLEIKRIELEIASYKEDLDLFLVSYELGYATMYQEWQRGSTGVCPPSTDGSHEFLWLQWRSQSGLVHLPH